MKTTGIVIGAGSDSLHAIGVARAMGVRVIAVDGNPEAAGFEFADEKRCVDISDLESVKRAVAEIRPDFVIPVPIGRYLTTIGAVNEAFGFKGLQRQGSIFSTDKYLFHQKLSENRLRNCRNYLLEPCKEPAGGFDISFPAIIKPRYGSGSRYISYLVDEDDLAQALDSVKNLKEDFVLEEAAPGDEYGVDGAVTGGKFQLILLRKKYITALPERQAVGYLTVMPGWDSAGLIPAVREYMQRVAESLCMDNCLLHADIMINGQDIFVIEASARPSGHNLHNVLVPLSTGVDMIKEYIHFLTDKPFSFIPKYTKGMLIRYFDFENRTVRYVPGECDIAKKTGFNLIKWKCNIKKGDYMNKVTDGHSIMDRGFFVIEGTDEEELQRQGNWILSQFEME